MSNDTETPGRRARCARWLGLDHNPLRRRDDRLEAVLRLATVLLILTAVPLAAIGVGRAADHLIIRQAQAERASDHQVSAVLTQAAPAQARQSLPPQSMSCSSKSFTPSMQCCFSGDVSAGWIPPSGRTRRPAAPGAASVVA